MTGADDEPPVAGDAPTLDALGASPSGQHVALEGQAIHAELMALELGSLCDAPAPAGADG